jgi:hypothetical protein
MIVSIQCRLEPGRLQKTEIPAYPPPVAAPNAVFQHSNDDLNNAIAAY